MLTKTGLGNQSCLKLQQMCLGLALYCVTLPRKRCVDWQQSDRAQKAICGIRWAFWAWGHLKRLFCYLKMTCHCHSRGFVLYTQKECIIPVASGDEMFLEMKGMIVNNS